MGCCVMASARTTRLLWTFLPGLVLIGAGLLVFAKMLDDVREHDDFASVDQAVLDWMVAHRAPWLTSVLSAITFVSGPVVLPILVLYAVFSRQLIRGITAGAVK